LKSLLTQKRAANPVFEPGGEIFMFKTHQIFYVNLKHFMIFLFRKSRISLMISEFFLNYFHPLTKEAKMDILFK